MSTADFATCVRIFEAEFTYIHRSLRRLGVAEADAEDLAQEVFLVMWRRRGDWDADRPLRPWLVGVAMRLANHHRRRRAREVPGGWIDAPDEAPAADQHVATTRAQKLVGRALATLSEKQREVLVLHELEDVPMREVADALSVPLFTAYSRLRSARREFARAVRRLQLPAAGAATVALATSAALLAEERNALAVPIESRARALARIRALGPDPAGGGLEPPHVGPAIGRAGRWLLGGATAAAIGGGALWVSRAPRPLGAGAGSLASSASPSPSALPGHAARPVVLTTMATGAPPPALGAAVIEGLDRSLVGYWRFDDGPGSAAAHDRSPGGNDCLLRHVDPATGWIDGRVGGALRLDRGWLECPRAQAIGHITTEMTIAAWIMLPAPDNDPALRALVTRQRGTGREDDFFFGLTGSHLLFGSDAWHRIDRPLNTAPGRWIHVAGVHEPGGGRKIYRDGVLIGNASGPRGSLGAAEGPGAHDRRGRQRPRSGDQHRAALPRRDRRAVHLRSRPLRRQLGALAGGARPRR